MKQEYLDILKQYWGYDSFRGIQADIIDSICSGRDTLGLMPTGGGKSVCFQVPALVMGGLCIVVTPLIALMKDQVAQLMGRGVLATAVYSGMMRDDIVRVLDNCVLGAYRFLYISPERMSSEIFMAKLERMRNVNMIVVDEAHCVSQWGYDFRPSYLQIAKIRHAISYHVPVLALTATASPKVVDDIQEKLEFGEKNVFTMSFERKNLIYVVRQTDDKIKELVKIVSRVSEGSVIVYVRTRQLTAELARFLEEQGFTASAYHAGLTDAEKSFRQANWTKDRVRIMVATNAFGMGIDKPNVRLVIHYNMPDSLEAYFQEAGRAGRDGKASYAVLLYSPNDVRMLTRRVPETYPDEEYVRQTYENVCCFLQVGEGEALGRTFFFPLESFCRIFKQFPVQTNSALKLLNNAGYIEYHEEQDFKSALRFILRKEDLYRLYEMNRDSDAVVQAILREYTGVFANFVYVEETHISHVTGLAADAVYKILKELHHNRVIDFIPRRKSPTVTFTMARVDTSRVVMPASVYKDRIADMENRIGQISEYASSTDKCRSRMLLHCFGQDDAPECGQCDVCLAKRKRLKAEIVDVKSQIKKFLSDGEKHRVDELYAALTAVDTPSVDSALRALLAEEEIKVQDSYISL